MSQPTTQGRFSGVMIASDFDGTVYSSTKGMLQRNIEAAHYFIAEGGTFSIATGRTHTTFAPFHHCLPNNGHTILSNGASVYDFKKDDAVSTTNLPVTIAEDLALLCQQMPQLAFEAYHDSDIYAYHPNKITDRHMTIVGSSYIQREIEDMPTPWLKVLIQEERDVLKEARTRLQKIRPNSYETIFSNPRYLEVTAAGINKGSAVLALAKDYGILPQHIYCVGDNENDLSMLALSAIPFAPSSSAKIVLETNPTLVCPCEEGVLGDIVTHLERIYPPVSSTESEESP